MAQFIRTPLTDSEKEIISQFSQVSQICYHSKRVIDIYWDNDTSRAVVQDNGQIFYLSSPDIPNISILNILDKLGYGDEQIIVTWVIDDNYQGSILNSPIVNVPINQIYLYSPHQQIPDIHDEGPFPEIVDPNDD